MTNLSEGEPSPPSNVLMAIVPPSPVWLPFMVNAPIGEPENPGVALPGAMKPILVPAPMTLP